MKKLLQRNLQVYFFLTLLLFLSNGVLAQWSFLGPSDQNRPNPSPTQHVSADCDKNGVVYVASMTTFEGFPRLPLIRKYQNGNWTTTLQLEENRAANITVSVNKFDNMPYVLFKDLFNGNKATLLKYDGANWNTVGGVGFSVNPVDSLLLSFDSHGNPLVVYENHDNYKSATLMTFSNGTWNTISTDLTPYFTTIVQFKLDKNDIPYILYLKNSTGYLQNTTGYLINYIGGKWNLIGNNFIEQGSKGISFDIDNNNEIYVAFSEKSSYDLVVNKWSGSNWISLQPTGLKYCRDNSKLSIINNIPYLVASDRNYNYVYYYISNQWVKSIPEIPFSRDMDDYHMFSYSPNQFFICYSNYSLYSMDAGNITVNEYSLPDSKWNILGSGGIGNGEIAYVDLELDRFGIPYLVSQDPLKNFVNVRKYINNNWVLVGNGFYVSPYQLCKIKFDKSNKPIILGGPFGGAWDDISSFNLINGIWQPFSNVNMGNTRLGTKPLVVDNNGHFIFASINSTTGRLSVMKYMNDKWDYIGSPSFSPQCQYYNIAVGFDNNPIVVTENNLQNKINAFIFNGTNWLDISTGIPTLPGYSPSLAIDNNGIPYMVFSDDYGKANILKYQNNIWTPVGNTTAIDFVDNYEKYIGFDKFNTPYFCFEGGGQFKISVARLKNNDWVLIGNKDISAPEVNMGGMKIFNNNLYVGYRNYNIYVQKYDISAILPLTFVSFMIKEENKNVFLNWKVNMPEDCIYYTIQKSDDGSNFVDIENVNSTNAPQYSYTDLSPKKGIKYYRIKAISKSRENIISIVCKTGLMENQEIITVAPNPIRDNSINLICENITTGKYSFSLINLAGETIYKSEKYLESNINVHFDLEKDLKKGLYILKILAPNGSLDYKKIIVK